MIEFEGVGPLVEPTIVRLSYQQAKKSDDDTVVGSITHIEMPFGNVVTNIPKSLVDPLNLSPEDNAKVLVEISPAGAAVFQREIPYVRSFGSVDEGQPLLYPDSLQTIGLAVNSGDFAGRFGIEAGADWTIRIVRPAVPE